MTTQKFIITDENNQPQGFLILQQPEQQFKFNSVALSNGHIADATFLLACLFGFSGFIWLAIAPLWIAVSIAVVISVALAALKIWRNGTGGQTQREVPPQRNIKIRIEAKTETGLILDEIRDDTITLTDLKKIAEAVIIYQKNFSRPALEKFVSQSKYHKIKDEFVRMNFAHKKGNSYVLSPRAFSFLKKVYNLP